MKAILAFICLCVATAVAAVNPPTGYWHGTATLGAEQRPVELEFYSSGEAPLARYSIPALGLEDLPMGRVETDPSSGNVKIGHAFEGRFDGNRLIGKLRPMLLHGDPLNVALRPGSPPAERDTIETDVTFESRGFSLSGTLVSPKTPGPHPALVSLHGSGTSTRWFALSRARQFARAGYPMLIFDKPGSGESGGDWTMSSLDDLATDAISAVEFLRKQPGIDPAAVGLWGHSQAGHVIGRAMPRSDHIAFAIVLAGGGATPREVEKYGYSNRLRRNGTSPAIAKAAMGWVSRYLDYESSGRGYDSVVAELDANPSWKEGLGVSAVYPTPDQQPKWSWVANYDPMADIAQIHAPVLLLFADKDEESPGARSLERWREGLAKAGNRNVEWKMFARADHHFLVRPTADSWPTFAPGYYEVQINWLGRLFGGRGERG